MFTPPEVCSRADLARQRNFGMKGVVKGLSKAVTTPQITKNHDSG
jgi:hypothetical protein